MFSLPAFAKIKAEEGVLSDGILYRPHANEVSALIRGRSKDKVLWTTKLPYSIHPITPIAGLEGDIQWCLAKVKAITSRSVEVTNCVGDEFYLEKKAADFSLGNLDQEKCAKLSRLCAQASCSES